MDANLLAEEQVLLNLGQKKEKDHELTLKKGLLCDRYVLSIPYEVNSTSILVRKVKHRYRYR